MTYNNYYGQFSVAIYPVIWLIIEKIKVKMIENKIEMLKNIWSDLLAQELYEENGEEIIQKLFIELDSEFRDFKKFRESERLRIAEKLIEEEMYKISTLIVEDGKTDTHLLDSIFTFAFSTDYRHDKDISYGKLFIELIDLLIEYNIDIKYGQCKCKYIDVSKLSKYGDIKLMGRLLIERLLEISEILEENIKARINNLNDEEKEFLSFFLNLDIYTHKYDHIFTYVICDNSHRFIFTNKLEPSNIIDKMIFYRFGDILVKSGIGYWIPIVNYKSYINLRLTVPNFLYDMAKKYSDILPKLEDNDTFFKKRLCGYDIFTIYDRFKSEKDFENLIENNLNIIEDGLVFIGRQYQVASGVIDILCENKYDNNYVIIELKKDKAAEKTILQIQRYIINIEENPPKGKKDGIRGIIVAKDFDKKLNDSIKCSRYRIDTITLNEHIINKAVKICDKCGNKNRLTVKYCSSCGYCCLEDEFTYQMDLDSAWEL